MSLSLRNPAGIATATDDPWRLNVDLHCHSHRSDGTMAPLEVVRRAHANGVRVLALTDHDEVSGLAEAQAEADRLGLVFVPGVEVSVTWADQTIHIVGLGIDATDRTLVDGLASVRGGRDARAMEMARALEAVGIHGSYEGALAHVGNPALISRTHFARFLVETGVCADTNEVFQRFLVEGKPGYVPQRWAKLSQAVDWIRGAGGVAVVAHPGRYRLDETAMWAFMTEFREAGGEAIEVVTGSHTRAQYQRFARMAIEFGFRASRGSDFHDPEESRVDLGELPPLPDSTVPVWYDWRYEPVADEVGA